MLASVTCVVTLTSLVDMMCGLDLSVSDLAVDESQTLSVFQKKRGTRATVECEQRNKAKTSMERPPVKAVPGAVRDRPTPQSAPHKAVPECVRNRAPLPPEGTQLQVA